MLLAEIDGDSKITRNRTYCYRPTLSSPLPHTPPSSPHTLLLRQSFFAFSLNPSSPSAIFASQLPPHTTHPLHSLQPSFIWTYGLRLIIGLLTYLRAPPGQDSSIDRLLLNL